ncbi:hypothetical protein K7G98_23760 [Saccharothrix sp. MB29]|nr:hypothetical protein [Saccharothrix sp. MB29]
MHDQLVPHRLAFGDAVLEIERGHGGGAQFDLSLSFAAAQPRRAAGVRDGPVGRGGRPRVLAGFTESVRDSARRGALEDLRALRAAARLPTRSTRHAATSPSTVDELVRWAARRTPTRWPCATATWS